MVVVVKKAPNVELKTNAVVRGLLYKALNMERETQVYLRSKQRSLGLTDQDLEEIRGDEMASHDIKEYVLLEEAAEKIMLINKLPSNLQLMGHIARELFSMVHEFPTRGTPKVIAMNIPGLKPKAWVEDVAQG